MSPIDRALVLVALVITALEALLSAVTPGDALPWWISAIAFVYWSKLAIQWALESFV